MRESQARYYQRNKQAAAERNAARSAESVMWSAAKQRAKRSGREFTISVEDIIIPTHCPALGIEMKRGTMAERANSPSLDRIDSSKGYVPGNVQVISQKANRMKNDATLEELKSLVAYLEDNNESA